MSIGEHCRREPLTARPASTLREAAELMKRKNTGSLVVVERNHPVGLLTDRDIALGVIARHRDPDKTKAKDLMSRPVVTLPEDASIAHAARVMRNNALRRLPLVDEKGRLVGIVTSDDLMRLVANELARLGDAVASQDPEHTSAPVPAGS